jgi:hypothetical protein
LCGIRSSGGSRRDLPVGIAGRRRGEYLPAGALFALGIALRIFSFAARSMDAARRIFGKKCREIVKAFVGHAAALPAVFVCSLKEAVEIFLIFAHKTSVPGSDGTILRPVS